MNLKNILIGLIVIAVVAVAGVFGYFYYIGTTGEVSQDIGDVAEQIDDAGEAVVFRIVSEESEASFSLEEDLRGNRVTVVGTTNQVGGDIAMDFANPSASQVSTITINAFDLQTDNNFRNGALRDRILLSSQDEYEFITFEPTGIVGLPDEVVIGETYSFDMIGNLTIIDTTNEVTFSTEVTIVSETEISGNARSSVLYADYGIAIPNAPGVANVTDDIDLEIAFIAREASEVPAEATEE